MRKLIFIVVFLTNFVFSVKADEQPYALLGENKTGEFTSCFYITESTDSFPFRTDARFELFNPEVKLAYDKAHWLRFRAVNVSKQNSLFLFRMVGKSAWRSNHMYAYALLADSVQYFRFGSIDKVSELRGTDKRSQFPLYIAAGDTVELYIKIFNSVGHHPKFKLYVDSPGYTDKIAAYVHSFHMFYEGLMWITVLVNFVIFLMYRERIYLYYAFYIAATAIYTLFFYRYLLNFIFTENPMWDPYVWIISISLAPLFYLLFFKHFVNSKEQWGKNWELALNGFVVAKFVIVAVEIVAFAITGNMRVLNDIIGVLIIVETLASIVFVVRLLKTKDKKVYYFGAASLFLWVGFILANTMYIFNVQNAQVFGELGVIGEILLFSLGLGYRMRENEMLKRKAQGELILQLETNKRLQNKVNRELETKVRERTAEIMQQQEEMKAQSEEIRDKNGELAKVNRQMTDSITYASYIQTAILGSTYSVMNYFNDGFVWLAPHSIVSGDFYWTTTVHKNDKIYQVIIAADCTGHGVRGAFMTVLGNDSLEETVLMSKNIMPNEILRQMDLAIKRRLHSNESAEKHRIDDGMDMSVITIDETEKSIYFAGAKNPLLHVRDGKMTHIKGSKYAIGGSVKLKNREKIFDLHTIKYKPEDLFYLYSDGFQDQFGEETNRKYLSHKFRDLLLGISDRPMVEQKVSLEQEHESWKGGMLQTDDILVVGIKM